MNLESGLWLDTLLTPRELEEFLLRSFAKQYD